MERGGITGWGWVKWMRGISDINHALSFSFMNEQKKTDNYVKSQC